jgi:hypothetical protein
MDVGRLVSKQPDGEVVCFPMLINTTHKDTLPATGQAIEDED